MVLPFKCVAAKPVVAVTETCFPAFLARAKLDPSICYLDEQHRQDDDAFLEILNALRAGDIRRRHAEQLLERLHAELPSNNAVTELYVTNMNVDSINDSRLAGLDGSRHDDYISNA